MCSGRVVVTSYDFESGNPGSNLEWGQYGAVHKVCHAPREEGDLRKCDSL